MPNETWLHPAAADDQRWYCDIVWGGNQPVLERFTMPGLEGCLLSVPNAERLSGGDIYHVTVCDQGVFSKFLLVDVAGHDAVAADIATQLHAPLHRLMNQLDNTAILGELNENILADLQPGNFATATAATYNHWDHSWTYAYAGHPYMLIRRNGIWEPLPECLSAPPAGVTAEVRYMQNEISLQGDDWLFLYSDAVFEIRRPDGRRIGFEGLVDLLNSLPEAHDIDTFYRELIARLTQENRGTDFDDDLTLILLRQTDEHLPVTDRALSGARHLMMRWLKRHDTRCTTILPGHRT
ncbi:stage II sporulation protein E [Thiogranum longum]|uniref:Stage II sporulation protein E n=1 Tax=Thiogranum longum TaxID=1537524 RepID=A0A4R1H9X8_9GAMM|nr:PP2C family protein-serine/threonine phosphatase [Thiogranum longum]TCK16930.1 stage II sporulation protein E [Thiogranum longum]